MAVQLEHTFTTARQIDDSFATILDLDRVVPCVEGASVLERTGPDAVRAEAQRPEQRLDIEYVPADTNAARHDAG